MELPPFSDFLASINPDKMDYDLCMYMSPRLKDAPNPLTNAEYEVIVRTCYAMNQTMLSTYHQWLAEQLHG